MMAVKKVLGALLWLICMLAVAECRRRKDQQLQTRETNVFTFVRLLFMRLVYGIASAMGVSDRLSEFMGGVFVPPGVDEDYGDYDYF